MNEKVTGGNSVHTPAVPEVLEDPLRQSPGTEGALAPCKDLI